MIGSRPLTSRKAAQPQYYAPADVFFFLQGNADAFFPKQYGTLASNLIGAIAELYGEIQLARIFEHLKGAAVARHSSRMAGKPVPRQNSKCI